VGVELWIVELDRPHTKKYRDELMEAGISTAMHPCQAIGNQS
jgi:hypothetical protein